MSKRQILIIDDDILLTRMYSQKFEEQKYECIVAKNGLEGLELVNEINPDVILCDIKMPVKDGLLTLKELKENEKTKNISVIMLAESVENQLAQDCINLGAIGYIFKNHVLPTDIVQKVEAILEKSLNN